MSRFAPFRVKLWSIHPTHRGRLSLKAIINDAADVGVSKYANEAGEMFFTLPINHPQINECLPMLRHYEVSRFDIISNSYSVVGKGLLEDMDATKDEVVLYGIDYLGLFTKNITNNNSSYTSKLIGEIIDSGFTSLQSETDSVYAFLTKGTIHPSTRSVTVVTSFEERLSFWRGLLEILQGSGSTRPLMDVNRDDPPVFSFQPNPGSDKKELPLRLDGAILDFRWRQGFYKLATLNNAFGVKREGASVLYSSQSYGSMSTYGRIYMSGYWTDLINQAELDSRTLAALREVYDAPDELFVSLAQGYLTPFGGGTLAPTTTWDLADSIPVKISRGPINIDKMFTIWGFEWIGRKNGSESLFLDLRPKRL